MYEDEVMDVNAAEPVYQDETLVCKECGKEFVFTAGEQRFYAGTEQFFAAAILKTRRIRRQTVRSAQRFSRRFQRVSANLRPSRS